jgi:hypothetical protein
VCISGSLLPHLAPPFGACKPCGHVLFPGAEGRCVTGHLNESYRDLDTQQQETQDLLRITIAGLSSSLATVYAVPHEAERIGRVTLRPPDRSAWGLLQTAQMMSNRSRRQDSYSNGTGRGKNTQWQVSSWNLASCDVTRRSLALCLADVFIYGCALTITRGGVMHGRLPWWTACQYPPQGAVYLTYTRRRTVTHATCS